MSRRRNSEMKQRSKTTQRTSELGELRLIGGQWKRTKLTFPLLPGVRPTPSRVRETLFNWLTMEIRGSHCLDLFTGSGALGLEALSRGAASCTMVDQQPDVCRYIKSHLDRLNADNGRIIQTDAMKPESLVFDKGNEPTIIFCDPPFNNDLVTPLISSLLAAEWFQYCQWFYLETESRLTDVAVPDCWSLKREKVAGDVCYRLYSIN